MSTPAPDQIPPTLDARQVETRLSEIPDWVTDMDVSVLTRTVQCDTFNDAMNLANAVARIAEEENHHPDILISYDTITFSLTTHDAGGLTDRDFLVAAKIDRLVQQDDTPADRRFIAG